MKKKEIEVEVSEDEKNLNFHYKYMGFRWCLIYDKNKDKCLLLKNGKPANVPKLSNHETEMYKEILSFAIEFHHEKGDAELH